LKFEASPRKNCVCCYFCLHNVIFAGACGCGDLRGRARGGSPLFRAPHLPSFVRSGCHCSHPCGGKEVLQLLHHLPAQSGGCGTALKLYIYACASQYCYGANSPWHRGPGFMPPACATLWWCVHCLFVFACFVALITHRTPSKLATAARVQVTGPTSSIIRVFADDERCLVVQMTAK